MQIVVVTGSSWLSGYYLLVQPGVASLDGTNAEVHGSLRLRVRMGSSVAGASPELEGWGVVWGERERVFLPVVLKSE